MQDGFINKKFKYSFWNVSVKIALINVAVFLATNYLNIKIKGISLIYWLSLVPAFVHEGFVWQFFTYMFVHSDISHLLFNLYALIMFGMTLERSIGSREFLCFYLVCGTFGGVLSWLVNILSGNYNIVLLGASGAIFALLFLDSVFFPQARVLMFYIIPLKMPVAVLFYIAIEVLLQISGTQDGIAHLVHLLSIFVAWTYCVVRFRISPLKVWKSVL